MRASRHGRGRPGRPRARYNPRGHFLADGGHDVMLLITFGAGVVVSGAHLDPAVTLALAIHSGFPWIQPVLVGALVVGALGGVVYDLLVHRHYQAPVTHP